MSLSTKKLRRIWILLENVKMFLMPQRLQIWNFVGKVFVETFA